MSDNIKIAFIRSFIFPLIAAVIIIAAFKAWHPERFSQGPSGERSRFAADRNDKLPVFGQVPDFSLIRENGEKISNADLQGKIWIANFIFTHCSGICPLMSASMSSLTGQLGPEPSLRFVSFSVDPERDTPAVLSRYARRFKAPADRWFFLTGDKAQIYRLSNQHFHLGAAEIAPEEREALDQSVRHSAKFVLVDRQGQIRGYYDSDGQNAGAKIIQDTRLLLGGG